MAFCEIPYYISEKLPMLHYSRLTPQSFEKGVNVKLFHRVEQIIPAQKLLNAT